MGASLAPQLNDKKAYKAVKTLAVPQQVLVNIYQPETALALGNEFVYNPGTDCLQFSEVLSSYGFKETLVNVSGELKTCFILWAVYNQNTVLRDCFTGILGLPDSWLYKYPGAIQAAWKIKQNGACKEDALTLLKSIGGSDYYSDSSGLSSYPQVITYKDTFPQGLEGIPVTTQLGTLFAANRSIQISDSVLPLLDPETKQPVPQYIALCKARNADATVPYAKLPAAISPAQYIFQKVWGPNACLLIVPDNNTQDISTAVQFIKRNTTLGTIFIVHTVPCFQSSHQPQPTPQPQWVPSKIVLTGAQRSTDQGGWPVDQCPVFMAGEQESDACYVYLTDPVFHSWKGDSGEELGSDAFGNRYCDNWEFDSWNSLFVAVPDWSTGWELEQADLYVTISASDSLVLLVTGKEVSQIGVDTQRVISIDVRNNIGRSVEVPFVGRRLASQVYGTYVRCRGTVKVNISRTRPISV